MQHSPVALAQQRLAAMAGVVEELCAAAEAGAATAAELLSMLTLCEGAVRRLDRLTVGAVAALQRQGAFAERGYSSPAAGLSDLLGWERFEARRRVTVAEQACPRTQLDGTVLPARLAETGAVFAAGGASLRHVEVIAKVLATPAAGRLAPEMWAGAEVQLAAKAGEYTPSELQAWGTSLIEALDQDGSEPDDRPPASVNELHLTPNPEGGGSAHDNASMHGSVFSRRCRP